MSTEHAWRGSGIHGVTSKKCVGINALSISRTPTASGFPPDRSSVFMLNLKMYLLLTLPYTHSVDPPFTHLTRLTL